jgi:hypothetical protein
LRGNAAATAQKPADQGLYPARRSNSRLMACPSALSARASAQITPVSAQITEISAQTGEIPHLVDP